jgi:hypothetical protein
MGVVGVWWPWALQREQLYSRYRQKIRAREPENQRERARQSGREIHLLEPFHHVGCLHTISKLASGAKHHVVLHFVIPATQRKRFAHTHRLRNSGANADMHWWADSEHSTRACARARTHTHTHTHTRTHIHIHTHAHIHTHISTSTAHTIAVMQSAGTEEAWTRNWYRRMQCKTPQPNRDHLLKQH